LRRGDEVCTEDSQCRETIDQSQEIPQKRPSEPRRTLVGADDPYSDDALPDGCAKKTFEHDEIDTHRDEESQT
jgi:hypothetical protein